MEMGGTPKFFAVDLKIQQFISIFLKIIPNTGRLAVFIYFFFSSVEIYKNNAQESEIEHELS